MEAAGAWEDKGCISFSNLSNCLLLPKGSSPRPTCLLNRAGLVLQHPVCCCVLLPQLYAPVSCCAQLLPATCFVQSLLLSQDDLHQKGAQICLRQNVHLFICLLLLLSAQPLLGSSSSGLGTCLAPTENIC